VRVIAPCSWKGSKLSHIVQLAETRKAALAAAQHILDKAGDDPLTAEQRQAYEAQIAIADDAEEDIINARRRQVFEEARSKNPSLVSGGWDPNARRSPEGEGAARNFLPSFAEYRALSEGTSSAGGYLVPVETANEAFFYLAAQSVVLKSGVRQIEMAEQTVNVPRVSAGATVAMFNEAATITEGDPTFAQAQLIARKAGAFILVSNEVLEDSNPSVRTVVSQDLVQQLARFLDKQFLAGNGTAPNLKGIRNFAGVTSTPIATNGSAVTSLDVFATALGSAQSANNDAADLVWYMHPNVFSEVRKAKDSQNRYLVAPDPTLGTNYSLFGVPVYLSSQLPTNETQGTSGAVCSSALLVNKTQIIVGRRREIQVQYSTDFAFQNDQTAVKATARFDIQLLDPAGIQIITGII
jgi:HK97 family phage major capsid protein